MVKDNEKAIIKALHADRNRHEFESFFVEVGGVKKDINAHIHHVDEWAADEIPDAGFLFRTLAGARTRKEPLGWLSSLPLGTSPCIWC